MTIPFRCANYVIPFAAICMTFIAVFIDSTMGSMHDIADSYLILEIIQTGN